jgi:hypothetical protein
MLTSLITVLPHSFELVSLSILWTFLQFPIKISTGFILVWIINCVVTEQLSVYFFTQASWFWESSRKSRTPDWRHESPDISKLITYKTEMCIYNPQHTLILQGPLRPSFQYKFSKSGSWWNFDISGQSLEFYPLIGNSSGISLKIHRICTIYFYYKMILTTPSSVHLHVSARCDHLQKEITTC